MSKPASEKRNIIRAAMAVQRQRLTVWIKSIKLPRVNLRRKNSRYRRIPFRLRLGLFFASHRLLSYIGLFIIGFGLLYGLIISAAEFKFLASVFPAFTDPGFTGLFGALFGALIGAFVSGFVSWYITSHQARSASSIAKKQEIYEPLYDELLILKRAIAQYPYSRDYYIYRPSEQQMSNSPLPVWIEIKQDSRFIRTPDWMAHNLDAFMNHVLEYAKAFNDTIPIFEQELIAIFNKHLVEYINQENGLHPGFNSVLSSIMNTEKSKGVRTIDIKPFGKDMSDDIALSIVSEINSNFPRMEPIMRLKYFYKTLIIHNLDYLIKQVAFAIRYIELRYENHEKLI